MIDELLEAARAAGVEVRSERLASSDPLTRSGLVTLKGSPVLFLDTGLAPHDQLDCLVRALRGADLENVYLSPAARALLEAELPAEPSSSVP